MSKINDLTGQNFGRLTVVGRAGREKTCATWLCVCSCGNQTIGVSERLRNGTKQSCGCIQMERLRKGLNTKHGLSGSPEWKTWAGMKERCLHPYHKNYADYGGRGITICKRWSDVTAFVKDMGPKPTPGHTIERIDVNGNYEPGNCKWATHAEQGLNKRNNRLLSFRGQTKPMMEWAREIGMSVHTLWNRIENGFSEERALTQPVRKRRK